jgi:hypothetical protein
MYSKALVGFERVVGPDHSMSQRLRERLQTLDAMMENKVLEDVDEPLNNSSRKTSRLGS